MRIAIRPYARVVGLVKGAVALFAFLASIGLAADVSDQLGSPENTSALWVAALAACIVVGVMALRAMWSNLRSAVVRKATFELSGAGVTLRHEGIFKKPVVLAHADIRVCSVDDRPARRRGRDHRRFPLPDGGEGRPGWLYARVSGSPFPILSQVPDVPNLAIVFARPVVLPKPRRFVKAFPSKQLFFPPLNGRPSRGLLMRVHDPAAVSEALQMHYPVRPLMTTDLEQPDVSSTGRARRLSLRDNIVMGSVIVAQFALPIALARDSGSKPPGSETFSALGQICGVEEIDSEPYEPRSESLGDLLVTSNADMSLMFDSLIDVGDAALFSRGDVGGWTQRLLDHGYERGYARRWNGPGLVLFATVWEFPSTTEAAGFEIFARNELCGYVQDAFLVPEVEGAVGLTLHTPDRAVDQVTFVRGRFRFLLGAEMTLERASHDPVTELTRRADALLERDD